MGAERGRRRERQGFCLLSSRGARSGRRRGAGRAAKKARMLYGCDIINDDDNEDCGDDDDDDNDKKRREETGMK